MAMAPPQKTGAVPPPQEAIERCTDSYRVVAEALNAQFGITAPKGHLSADIAAGRDTENNQGFERT